jgi:glucose-6-phosphate 1-dehydrogenase
VAIKAQVANWRWGNVPFYLRTGQAAPLAGFGIVIAFKSCAALHIPA